MAKSKTHPTIQKPVFDPEAALRFAEEGGGATDTAALKEKKTKGAAAPVVAKAPHPGYSVLTMQIREELLAKARVEAARKGRTLEEYVEKLISKHVGKH
jgi:hypothetical protein